MPRFILALLLLAVSAFAADQPVLSLIGKDIRSKEVQAFLEQTEAAPEIRKFDDSAYYSFKRQGISLRLDLRGNVTTVFLYAEGVDGFRQYQGALPFGLNFSMTRKEVEKKIGLPPAYNGGGVINLWAKYPTKKISVTYDSKEQADPAIRLATITVGNK